jgi:hypothetical protein
MKGAIPTQGGGRVHAKNMTDITKSWEVRGVLHSAIHGVEFVDVQFASFIVELGHLGLLLSLTRDHSPVQSVVAGIREGVRWHRDLDHTARRRELIRRYCALKNQAILAAAPSLGAGLGCDSGSAATFLFRVNASASKLNTIRPAPPIISQCGNSIDESNYFPFAFSPS